MVGTGLEGIGTDETTYISVGDFLPAFLPANDFINQWD